MEYYIIAYDIKDNTRRLKIFKTLKGYAAPVQYSIFEGYISREDVIRLKYELKRHMNEREDSVCFYRQCANCREKITRFGVDVVVFGQDDIII